jgi:hypothetical protein
LQIDFKVFPLVESNKKHRERFIQKIRQNITKKIGLMVGYD